MASATGARRANAHCRPSKTSSIGPMRRMTATVYKARLHVSTGAPSNGNKARTIKRLRMDHKSRTYYDRCSWQAVAITSYRPTSPWMRTSQLLKEIRGRWHRCICHQ